MDWVFSIIIGAGVVAATLEAFRAAFFLGVVGYIWLIFGSVYYRIFALNYLTSNKLLNGQIGFYSGAQAGKVVGIAIKGTLLIALVGAVIGLVSRASARFYLPQWTFRIRRI